MLRLVHLCATVTFLVATSSALATDRLTPAPEPAVVRLVVPGLSHEITIGASQLERGMPPRTLVAAIADWVAAEMDLPPPTELPRIQFASPAGMIAMRYGGVDAGKNVRRAGSISEIVAVYRDEAGTIFLPERWTGRSAVELSVLVHEMVHHLQFLAGQKFACAAAREKKAYAVQERWLAMLGGDLLRDFQMDALTLMVRTVCDF